MPRARSPKRDEAYNLWLNSNGSIALKDIAEQLGLSDVQIRKWKNEDKWVLPAGRSPNGKLPAYASGKSNVTKRKKGNAKSNVTNKKSKSNSKIFIEENKNCDTEMAVEPPKEKPTQRNRVGAPPGNQNAAGNRGGKGGPIRNKHALKTREFETIFWTADILDEEEKSLLDADYDKYLLQYLLIDTLNIREKRILQDIKKLKTTDGGMVFDSVTKNKTTTTTQYTKRDAEGEETPGSSNTVTEDGSSHIAVPILKRIMELEEALTRVQGKKQRAIEVLHKMEMDDEKLAIDHVKLKLYKQRITGQINLDELIDNDDFGEDLDIDLD